MARAAGAPVDQLAPGVDADTVGRVFHSAGLPCHPELLEWFGWHDGYSEAKPSAAMSLPQMIAGPLRSSVEWGPLSDPNQAWMLLTEEAWGPAVDLGTPDSEPLRVGFVSDDFDPEGLARRGGVVRSLATMVAWWIIGIDSGGYVWNGIAWDVHEDLLHPSQRSAHFF